MSIENKNSYQLTERGEKLKKRTKIAVKYLGGAATVLAIGAGVNHAASGPEMKGEQVVQVNSGDTTDGLIKTHVEGGESHTGAVRAEVLNNPDNADVFENDQLDPGEELELPEKVQ